MTMRRHIVICLMLAACIDSPDVPLCNLGASECAGRCVELDVDRDNCGACANVCPTASICHQGQCQQPCGAGLDACGGACVSLSTDPLHCGGCDQPCPPEQACIDGACSSDCVGESILCDGACVDPSSDNAHCGDCHRACAEGRACVEGECQPYAACEHRWSSAHGATSNQRAAALALFSDGRTVAAFEFATALPLGCPSDDAVEADDIALAVFDAQGNASCLVNLASAGSQTVSALAVDPSGNVVLAGNFTGSIDLGALPAQTAHGQDGFVAEIDATGNVVWAIYLTDTQAGVDAITTVAIDPQNGDVVVGGSTTASAVLIDAQGDPLTLDTFEGTSDAFVARFDDLGVAKWAHSWGDSQADRVNDVAVKQSGAVVITGSFSRDVMLTNDPPATLPIDAAQPLQHRAKEGGFVAELDTSGDHVWSHGFANPDLSDYRTARGSSLAVGPADEVWLFGEFTAKVVMQNQTLLSSAGTQDMLLARLAANGTLLGSWGLGGDGTQVAVDLAVADDQFIVASGYFSVDVDLSSIGGGKLTSAGSQDVFVLVAGLPDDSSAAPLVDCARSFGDASQQRPRALVARDGVLHLAGFFSGSIELGGRVLSSAGGQDAFVAALGL
ncbi:MAG TPA: MXAN_6577-like cysteine-rich protein [Polyangiaceae bacterium]|nr:MXAN_6577-like cysteine-rich protein [Polyangiaceae bacterium]